MIPLAKPEPLARFAGLAWGSTLRLRSGSEELAVLTGPAKFQTGGWHLPAIEVLPNLETATAEGRAEHLRRQHGYLPIPGDVRLEGALLLLHLHHRPPRQAPGHREEGRRWHADRGQALDVQAGSGSFIQAQAAKLDLPILFADATDCSRRPSGDRHGDQVHRQGDHLQLRAPSNPSMSPHAAGIDLGQHREEDRARLHPALRLVPHARIPARTRYEAMICRGHE